MLNKFTLSLLSICATCYCANANDIGKLNSDEKVVATTGFEHSLKDEAHNVYVISSDEIAKKGYRNIKEALERVPGVSFVKKSDRDGLYRINSEHIDMRGQGQKANSTVKLMINGVSINMLDISNFGNAFVPFEMIAIEDVERIEVVPGGGSVLYGSGTQGGVINIITKKTPREFYGSIKSEIGSYKYRDVSANVGGSITDKLFLNFSSKVFNTKGYQRDEKDRGYYLRGSLNYQISDTRNFELSSSVYKNKFDYGLLLKEKQLLQDKRQNPFTYKQDFTKFDVMSNYQVTLDNLTLNIKPYYQDIKIKNKENEAIKAFIEDEKIGLNFSTKFDYENGELITGYEMLKNSGKKNSEYINSGYYNGNFENFYKLTHSLYFMERHNFTSNFDLSVGARVEHSVNDIHRREIYNKYHNVPNADGKATRNNFALEIMPNFKYSDTGNLYFKFERGYNSPNPMQLVDLIHKTQKPNVHRTNNLKSEIFNTYEIGLKDTLFDSIHIATALFYTKTKDEIIQEYDKVYSEPYEYLNIDKTRRLGFEIDLKEEIFDGLKLTQSYSYINAKENSSQHDGYYSVPLVSKHKLAIGAIYEPVKNLSLFADMRYYSKQNYWDLFYQRKSPQATYEKSKSKTVVDVGANYEFNNGLSLGAGVNNLLNKKYFDYERKYNKGGIDDEQNPIGAYAPARERNFYARIKYEF
ncbi:MAG: TonB-dependent receptor [Campylobacter sp.]